MIKDEANFRVRSCVFDLTSRFDSQIIPMVVNFPLVINFRDGGAASEAFVLVLHFHLDVIAVEAGVEKPSRRWARDIVLNEADPLAVERIIGVSDVKPEAQFYKPSGNG